MHIQRIIKQRSSAYLLTFVLIPCFVVFSLFLTPRVSHAAGTTYYVDSVGGNDGNNGQSAGSAWQSLGKVNSTTFQAGDRILFAAGDTWTGQLSPKGSGNSGATITIDQYGSGNKPRIDGAGVTPATVWLSNQPYWDINNLEVTDTASSPDYRDGIRVDNSTGGELDHIHISNTYVHNVSGYPAGYFDDNAAIAVNSIAASTPNSHWNDVLIQGNRVDSIDRMGIIVGIETANHTDVGAPGNVGTSANITIQNNSLSNLAGDGIMCYGTTNCLVQYNTSNGSGGGLETCPPASQYCQQVSVAMWAVDTTNSIFQYNEVTGSGGGDGEAFDSDWGTNGVIFQYNYSHDNPGGFMTFYNNYTNAIFRYNISQNDGRVFVLNGSSDPTPSQIYNNTVFVGSNLNSPIVQSTAKVVFTNNLIVNEGSGGYENPYNTDLTTWDYNLFYGNHPSTEPNDPHKITADPLLANPGGAGSGRDSASAYQLLTGSPAIGAGTVITNNGGQDFFGNPVSSTNAPNIGAYNGPGITASTGSNLARGKTAFATSTSPWCGCFSPSSLTDGNNGSFWSSQELSSSSANERAYVDLGSQRSFDRVTLYPRYDGNGNALGFPSAFQIQGSNDGSNWTTLVSENNFVNPTGGIGVGFWVGSQSYRYVGVLATTARTDGSNYYVQIAELEVYNNALSTGKVASASSTPSWCGTCFGPTNLTDNNNGTLWSSRELSSPSANEWAYVDLASQATFDRVTLYPRYDGNGNALAFPTAFQLQGSNDTSNWSTLANVSNFSPPTAGTGVTFWVGTQSYRYVRILATTATTDGSNYYVQVAELEVQNS